MQTKPNIGRPRRLIHRAVLSALLTLAAPAVSNAQQTVFNDTFGTSTLYQTNIPGGIPGGTPTASWTSYTIGSAKSALSTRIGSGHLELIQGATSSGNLDCAAVFTKYPVMLAALGDFIEMDYTFTDTQDILQSTNASTAGLFMGVFNSGGVAPLATNALANSGFSSSLTTADTGGTVNWEGYNATIYNASAWNLSTRFSQASVANNLNQQLLYNLQYVPSGSSKNGANPGSPNLLPGTQYTCQLRLTLSAAGTLTVSNGLYLGVGTAGMLIASNYTTWTGANLLTTNFDSLAIGYRAANSYIWTNDVNAITVIAGLAAQAGPYYTVTSSGTGCGSVTVGLSGSVSTNAYLLYTNGVNSGFSLPGTGSALSFGLQTAPAVYTVIASNTATASVGPMYGQAVVTVGAPVITGEPSSVTTVTNLAVALSVASTGNGLTYQWYKNGVVLTNGDEISGAQTTNLMIFPAGLADAATTANGYYVVIQDPCGDVVTSAPLAALTLTTPNQLTWQGGNTDGNWEYSELNFINPSGSAEVFSNGDMVVFDDSSANTSVTLTNSVIPTLVTVNSANGYNFSGVGKITGLGMLVDAGPGTLTIANNDDYTGGTIINSGATVSIGNGSGTSGSVAGFVTIQTNATLTYNYGGSGSATLSLNNGFAGNGTVNIATVNGATVATKVAAVSSNFNGTINIQGNSVLHASAGNSGYALGNGSTINAPDNTQVWLDNSATVYNNTFNVGGNGWLGASPGTGGLRIYNCTVTGPVNILDSVRIGGTIAGATITGVISDAGNGYQLEVYGVGYGLGSGSSEFILSVSNNANVWGSTLITSGALRALAAGAISTNSMTINSLGELDTYGNTVVVANLNDGGSGAGAVYNMSTATNGTLVVGGDGSSTTFDGTFGNGASKPLNLTKVGAGTLTLTAVNTNTGTVAVNGGTLALSGSGSFGNAAVVAPASGAIYDVTGAGGTLTLNSGQTLQGSGTVNGNVIASAGSIIDPGDSIGALTITGNAALSGALVMELNRTNAPATNDSLIVLGTLTTGGTLAVTNLGLALHVGDSFQLFSAAVSGFSSVVLQTLDTANNIQYTWNNTLASNGKITVLTATTLVNTNPAPITFSNSNSSLTLSWPSDRTGWTLQAQTNSLNTGLGTNWVNVSSSTTTNIVIIPVNATNGGVYYRLKY